MSNSNQFLLKSYLMLLFGVTLICSCQTQAVDFKLTPREDIETLETVVVQVNNCDGRIIKFQIYNYPFATYSLGVENLAPNGDEPFISIKERIWNMYGKQAFETILLTAPRGTKREFSLTVTKIQYQGIVSGDIIDTNKIIPNQEAVYFYPFIKSIVIDSHRDMTCR